MVTILDSTGTAVVQYKYDAWGRPISKTGSLANTLGTVQPFRYRGYVYDEEAGLYYLQSRYYDPENARFLNADIYVSTGSGLLDSNMFTYCRNNPVIRRDAAGTYEWDLADNDDAPGIDHDKFGRLPDSGAKAKSNRPTTVDLYRSVCPNEADSFTSTGKFSAGAGQMEGKFFATTQADAQMWGARLNNSEIITIQVPYSALQHDSVHYFERLDAIGPAYYFSDMFYLNTILR